MENRLCHVTTNGIPEIRHVISLDLDVAAGRGYILAFHLPGSSPICGIQIPFGGSHLAYIPRLTDRFILTCNPTNVLQRFKVEWHHFDDVHGFVSPSTHSNHSRGSHARQHFGPFWMQ